MPLKEEVLGQFLGDESFPVTWDVRDREGALLGLRRPALPPSAEPDVLRHRRLVADLRPHVPPVRHARSRRLDRQERQRLRLHDGDPGRRRAAQVGAHGVRRSLRRRRAGRPELRREDRHLPRRRPADLRARSSSNWWRDRLVPEMERNFAYLEGDARRGRTSMQPDGAGLPARGRDRHPRSPLEDPLDAQLRAALGDAQPARGHGEDAREGRRGSCSAGSRTPPRTATGTRSRRSGG